MISIEEILPELQFSTARSGGAGGQNVNKVETKVEIRFHPASSKLLSEEQKELILKNLGSKLTIDGFLIVTSQEERTQLGNRASAQKKLVDLLNAGLKRRKKRKATKPSAEAKEKRLQEKRKLSEKKAGRSRL